MGVTSALLILPGPHCKDKTKCCSGACFSLGKLCSPWHLPGVVCSSHRNLLAIRTILPALLGFGPSWGRDVAKQSRNVKHCIIIYWKGAIRRKELLQSLSQAFSSILYNLSWTTVWPQSSICFLKTSWRVLSPSYCPALKTSNAIVRRAFVKLEQQLSQGVWSHLDLLFHNIPFL